FMDFIQYGLRYVFPAIPGSLVTGIPTAHSHPFYQAHFSAEINYVWPSENGAIRGLSIQPLHAGVPVAVNKDPLLYELLASIDIIRVGRRREINLALKKLQHHILS